MSIAHDNESFDQLHRVVVTMIGYKPNYKSTEEFASDLIHVISSASEILNTITRQSIALDKSKSQLRDFLSTNAY